MVLINILTRTGSRPRYFSALKESISAQTYQNYRHLKSNDNPNCSYLSNEADVFQTQKNKKLGRGFYNLYLNELGRQVTEGWIIVLDDDSKLINDSFLERLAAECSQCTENTVLIYQSRVASRTLPSPGDFKNKNIRPTGIDMGCFCFHKNLMNDVQFDGRIWGDINFLSKIKKKAGYEFKFVKMPVGVWANYDGQKLGN